MRSSNMLEEVSTITSADTSSPHLPTGLVMLEQATAALRGFLDSSGLSHYVICHADDLELDDIDNFLERLDPHAMWQPLPLLDDGAQPSQLKMDDDQAQTRGVGVLHLPRQEFVLARWNWVSMKYNVQQTTALVAAPDRQVYTRLHKTLVGLRRDGEKPSWEIIRGLHDRENRPRKSMPWSEIMLAPALQSRLQSEVINFFTPAVSELYRKMNVPYRRGVLMHGPPGNGKTSIIRALGASMPEIYAMILRPSHSLGDAQLKWIFRRWRKHAPAMLVIEDLDHLLKDLINLSAFLNHIDGIDGALTGGLLLLATTNHPDRLDPAVNNRPGRFDVVIEIPNPDRSQREEFFRAQIAGIEPATLDAIVSEGEGLSFSHLHEVVRLSGLLAITEQQTARTCDHIRSAARLVAEGHRAARNGFPVSSETPFGLAQFRRKLPNTNSAT